MDPADDRRIVLAVADGPWGPVHIAAGLRGVVALAMLSSDEAFVADLDRRRVGAPVPIAEAQRGPAKDLADLVRTRVQAALGGKAAAFDDLPIDLRDRSDWDRLVLDGVRSIPRGEVASYGEVARRIGRPGAARAVGGAVARNPVGLLVPCHRVIAGDGSLGGYGVAAWGGREAALDVKRGLLALEGVHLG
ncbi:MAG TPA: methylated-DNA--[protein]-cysteine S-methyltransferase [Candidatus Limnocylindrales bacterium]